jgi:type VI secretion system protein ImpC
MPGRISFDVNLGNAPRARARARQDVLRILVLGDWSGRSVPAPDAKKDLAARAAQPVDLDTFDDVLRRMAPELRFGPASTAAATSTLQFESLEDFHPDRLYATLEGFRALRGSRARLLDPATFEQEASALMVDVASPATPHAEPATGMLERLLGAQAAAATRPKSTDGVVDDLIRRLVRPHIQPGPTRSAAPYLAALDASAAELMRAVLHDPAFQALEANWRGLRRFVESVAIGEAVTLHVANVAKADLYADLEATQGDPERSSLARMLQTGSQPGADAAPWSLLVGIYEFDAAPDDLALLGYLGMLAARAGAPLLAGGRAGLVGCSSLDESTDPRGWAHPDPDVERRWMELRRSPVARWLGLAMPRVLLRLPYGARTDAIDAFAFEEPSSARDHEEYLWGNPALACAELVALQFLAAGPGMSLDGPLDLDDLPAHVRDVDGERRLQPCGERALPLRIGEELLQRGMIPLLSYAQRNAVRILRLQSIADPPAPLAGLGG